MENLQLDFHFKNIAAFTFLYLDHSDHSYQYY